MQSHRVLWNVSLSNGENFREGSGRFVEIEGGLSPWQQLKVYLLEWPTGRIHITALWLTCPNGARHVLPSMGIRHKPLLSKFHEAEPPTGLRCFRKLGGNATPGDPEIKDKDLYTVGEATFETYKVQIFVSEHDPNLSWVLVTPNESAMATG
jgi:hypothetical protein